MSALRAPELPSHARATGPTPRTRRLWRAGAGAVTAITLALTAGCGSGGDSTPSSNQTQATAPAGAFPVTVTGTNGDVVIEQRPEAIVSLSPSATEMLFAIGAGDQVKAVDDQSTYPAEAPKTELSGYTPNVEAIAGHQPDLVVLANDTNGIVPALEKLDITVLQLTAATKVQESLTQTSVLGAATGHIAEAADVVTDVQKRLTDAVASMPAEAKGAKVYHELDPTFYSVTSDTFIGDVYAMLGLRNIADDVQDASGGYPKLSSEFVVKAQPDLIVLADSICCQQDAAAVAKRPGFKAVPAVKNGKVVGVSDDVASRWGPRVADFAESVAAAFQPAGS